MAVGYKNSLIFIHNVCNFSNQNNTREYYLLVVNGSTEYFLITIVEHAITVNLTTS